MAATGSLCVVWAEFSGAGADGWGSGRAAGVG